MIKHLKFFTIITILILCILLTGCTEFGNHTHTFEESWSSDFEYHWHAATCGHQDEKKNYAAHKFGDWQIIKEATKTETGFKKRICKVCDYVAEEVIPKVHEHTFSEKWAYDEKTHWHPATCEHKEEKDAVDNHKLNGLECEICHYIRDELDYELLADESGYKVTGAYINTLTSIVIPDKHNDKPVVEIAEYAFEEFINLTNVSIGKNIVAIGDGAFQNCHNIKKIVLPKNVKTLGLRAFYNCNSLESITLNENLTTIGGRCFSECLELTKINIPNSVKMIGQMAFEKCLKLKEIELGNGIEHVETDAFSKCINLADVYYGGTIEKWCEIQFDSYSSNPMDQAQHFYLSEEGSWQEVYTLEIPNTVKIIREYTFYSFEELKSIKISNSIEIIYEEAFNECQNITSVYYGGTIEKWCEIVFKSTTSNPCYFGAHLYLLNALNEWESVSNLNIPDSVTKIGDYTFAGFTNLKNITISNSVMTIGKYAFYRCSNVEKIILSNKLVSIAEYAFYGCSMRQLYLPESLISIGAKAFANCYLLTELVIPNSVETLGNRAFYSCRSLSSVVINNSDIVTGIEVFGDCSIEAAVVPAHVISLIASVNLLEVEITSGEIIEDRAFAGCKALKKVTLSETINSIGAFAFQDCICLEDINLPQSLMIIKERTFENCSSLKNIVIPEKVVEIGDYAFAGCINLTNVEMGTNIQKIGEGAFKDCPYEYVK